ncbi:MAG: 30S ribosomal protein S7 [Planctomycetota bacterium]|nr:30S ribosomal protein S7 [Planctomycetota bacterium]MEE2712315.1 30S ribosomal protein S7 [Planctomycetota bacterium]
MPRKYDSPERFLKPDPKYDSKLVSKFINSLMYSGKKNAARKVFYDCMELIVKKTSGEDPLEVFNQAINNIKPAVEVRSKRVGGATYQVPIEVKRARQQNLAFRWLLEISRGRKGRPMAECLADELLQAYNREGATITKRENTHKMADANKMNAHFAW